MKPSGYPVRPFEQLTMMLFGIPGSGKTWFAQNCPGVLFIPTEPGQEFTKAAAAGVGDPPIVPDWVTFTSVIGELVEKRKAIKAGKLPLEACPYTCFAIDIVDNLYAHCRDFVCKQKGLAYPPQNDYGRTWGEITAHWKEWITATMRLGNVIFLTHCATEPAEIDAGDGVIASVDRQFPTFRGNKGAQYLDGIVNAVGYISVNKTNEHVITFKQQATVAAKDRTDILSKLGTVPSDWNQVSAAYQAKAQELGFEVRSKKPGG